MSQFIEPITSKDVNYPNSRAKHASECHSLTDHQNAVSTSPVKFEIDFDQNGRFGQFLDFVERAMSQKRSNEMSTEIQTELQTWFPFINSNMTVFLNVDIHVKENAEKNKTLEKPQCEQKIILPKPLPRSFADNPDFKTKFSDGKSNIFMPEIQMPTAKMFIPTSRAILDTQQISSCELEPNKKNTTITRDVELDNLYLSGLLRKREDGPQISRTAIYRPLKLDDLNERLISNHIVKVRSFWNGSTPSYPHSFKKLVNFLVEGNNESNIEEIIDHSKKVIPTMDSEPHSIMGIGAQDN